MMMRLVPIMLTIVTLMASWASIPSYAGDAKVWDLLNKQGYDFHANTFARHGDNVYFIGKNRLSPEDSHSRDRVLRLNLAAQAVEECIPPEETGKYFSERMVVNSCCFALDQQGTRLAVGSTSVTLTPERKTETRILLVDLRAKQVRCLVDNQSDNIDYRFSPDGRFLLFRSYPPEAEQRCAAMEQAGSFSVCVVDVARGAVTILKDRPRDLTPFYMLKVPAAWSPDGQHLVFEYLNPAADLTGRHEIYSCGVRDWTPKLLMKTRFGLTNAFFIDAGRFIAGASDAIDLINLKSGQIQQLVSSEKKPMSNIHRAGNSIEYGLGSAPNISVERVEVPPR